MKKMKYQHLVKYTLIPYSKNMLLLLTLINVITSCTNMSQIYCDHGASNDNNFYFVPISIQNSVEQYNIGENILDHLNSNLQFKYDGIWGNNTFDCEDGDCYRWSYIIPTNMTIFNDSSLSKCKMNYHISHNLIIVYKKWDIASAHNFNERLRVFGDLFLTVRLQICQRTLPHIETNSTTNARFVGIILVTVFTLLVIIILLMICFCPKNNEEKEYQIHTDNVTTYNQNDNSILLEPVYKNKLEMTCSIYDNDQSQILLQPVYTNHHV